MLFLQLVQAIAEKIFHKMEVTRFVYTYYNCGFDC